LLCRVVCGANNGVKYKNTMNREHKINFSLLFLMIGLSYLIYIFYQFSNISYQKKERKEYAVKSVMAFYQLAKNQVASFDILYGLSIGVRSFDKNKGRLVFGISIEDVECIDSQYINTGFPFIINTKETANLDYSDYIWKGSIIEYANCLGVDSIQAFKTLQEKAYRISKMILLLNTIEIYSPKRYERCIKFNVSGLATVWYIPNIYAIEKGNLKTMLPILKKIDNHWYYSIH